MSDVEQSEQISQPETSEENQALDAQGQPEPAIEEPQYSVPQKFLEASKIDVIQSYQALEKERGRLANELGELRKQQEEMDNKYKELEAQRFTQPPAPAYAQQPIVAQDPVQQQLDPVSVFDSKFDEDPKEAIRELARLQREEFEQRLKLSKIEQETAKGYEFFHEQKQTNPDFARREPVMQQLSQQYGHIIKPEYANSVDALRALDLMSRGADVGYYQKTAVEDLQKQRASVTEEKRRAHSETATSSANDGVDFKGMSNEEYMKYMEQLHGHHQPE